MLGTYSLTHHDSLTLSLINIKAYSTSLRLVCNERRVVETDGWGEAGYVKILIPGSFSQPHLGERKETRLSELAFPPCIDLKLVNFVPNGLDIRLIL